MAERAEQAARADVAAAGVVARRAVGLQPAEDAGAEIAQVGVAGGARHAAATRRDAGEHDVVAGREPVDALADLQHHAGALVPTDDGQRHRQVAGDRVLVAVAQPGGGELHQHLTRPGGSSSISSTLHGEPISHKMAAFVFIDPPRNGVVVTRSCGRAARRAGAR